MLTDQLEEVVVVEDDCGEEEAVARIFRSLKEEDAAACRSRINVDCNSAAPIPSPVCRAAEQRHKHGTWLDGVYIEMVANDAEMAAARKRDLFSPATTSKRQRSWKENMEFGLPEVAATPACTTLGAWCPPIAPPPRPTPRLDRHARRQAARDRRRACREEADLHQLAASLGRVVMTEG